MSHLITFVLLLLSIGQAFRPDAIRGVDFRNFSYPWPEDYVDAGSPDLTFTLSDGEVPLKRDSQGIIQNTGVTLGSLQYGDLTGDGIEEAVISLGIITGGSAIPGIVYVYGLRDDRPSLLWRFETGDRADGGLRDLRIEKSRLVVDTYLPEGSNGDCCPTKFLRTVYRWRTSAFEVDSTAEFCIDLNNPRLVTRRCSGPAPAPLRGK